MPAKKQIPKETILTASLNLLREGGMDAVNIKKIVKRLGCSTQPIYLSFSGMDELREETAKAAQNFFLQFLQSDSGEFPCLYGLRYIRFAKEESRLFQYLFMRQNAYEEMKSSLLPIMEHAIHILMEQHNIGYEDGHRFHDELWVYAHGIAAMIATDYCVWDMDTVKIMLDDCKVHLGKKYGGQRS